MEVLLLVLFLRSSGKSLLNRMNITGLKLPRCLLVEDGNSLILIDTGMGRKQSGKYYSYRHLFGEETLQNSFKEIGYCLMMLPMFFLPICMMIIVVELLHMIKMAILSWFLKMPYIMLRRAMELGHASQ